MKELAVAGDVVWSDAKQEGYMRFTNLPKNDASVSTYQLWIFDETQSDKTPIDGGTFDVNADGEVIIPIDAKLKARGAKAFAITVEKPGGVVVSDRKKIPTLAPVKPNQA
jgi:anti-sigma-K factor RskA